MWTAVSANFSPTTNVPHFNTHPEPHKWLLKSRTETQWAYTYITNGGDTFEVYIRQWERRLPGIDEVYDQKVRGVSVMRNRLNPANTSHATASESHTETQMSQNTASNLPHRVFSLLSQSIPPIRNLFSFHRHELFPEHLMSRAYRVVYTRSTQSETRKSGSDENLSITLSTYWGSAKQYSCFVNPAITQFWGSTSVNLGVHIFRAIHWRDVVYRHSDS